MGDHSAIEWTEATLNIWTGCTKVSPACAHCYIERSPPFRIAGRKFERGHIPLVFYPERLELPLRWKRPRRIFIESLSDIAHDDVPYELFSQLMNVMNTATQHTFQVLTKRPVRLREMVERWHDDSGEGTPPNVWFGVSVENDRFRWRIDELLLMPAAVYWVSAEPLLGDLDLTSWLPRLQWVVTGFESGPGFRPPHPEWVRHLRDQCVKYDVAFLFKQWGGTTSKSGGRDLDGRTWDEYPRVH